MLKVNGKQLIMNAGDYGETVEFKLINGTILENDDITLIIENKRTFNNIIEKKLDITGVNEFEFTLTEEETALLDVGTYLWGILWERNGELVDTLEVDNFFTVERGLANAD